MKIELGSGEIRLTDNQPISLRGARGLRIVCTAGTIWITVAGEPGDTFLTAGQAHIVHGNGLTLVEGIGNGGIRIGKAGKASAVGAGLAMLRRLLGSRRQAMPRRASVLPP